MADKQERKSCVVLVAAAVLVVTSFLLVPCVEAFSGSGHLKLSLAFKNYNSVHTKRRLDLAYEIEMLANPDTGTPGNTHRKESGDFEPSKPVWSTKKPSVPHPHPSPVERKKSQKYTRSRRTSIFELPEDQKNFQSMEDTEELFIPHPSPLKPEKSQKAAGSRRGSLFELSEDLLKSRPVKGTKAFSGLLWEVNEDEDEEEPTGPVNDVKESTEKYGAKGLDPTSSKGPPNPAAIIEDSESAPEYQREVIGDLKPEEPVKVTKELHGPTSNLPVSVADTTRPSKIPPSYWELNEKGLDPRASKRPPKPSVKTEEPNDRVKGVVGSPESIPEPQFETVGVLNPKSRVDNPKELLDTTFEPQRESDCDIEPRDLPVRVTDATRPSKSPLDLNERDGAIGLDPRTSKGPSTKSLNVTRFQDRAYESTPSTNVSPDEK